jgi:hypothetical protein
MLRSRYKAQSNVILPAIFLAVFTIAIAPLAIFMIQVGQTTPSEKPLKPVLQGSRFIRGEMQGVYDENSTGLLLINNAGEDVDVDRLIIQLLCSGNTQTIGVSSVGRIHSGGSVSLNVSQYIPTTCKDPTIKTIQVVSQTGVVMPVRVVSLKELLSGSTGPGGGTNTSMPIASPITIDLSSSTFSGVLYRGGSIVTVDPDRGMTGGLQPGHGYRWVFKLDKVFNNVAITIWNQPYRNIWIGYDPRNPSRYNILIATDYIEITTPYYSTGYYTRVKIIGFTPSTPYIVKLGGIEVYKPSENIANPLFSFQTGQLIYLNGIAERVEIYVRIPETQAGGYTTGYEPYMLYMNTKPSQGLKGLLFTTIDRLYGFLETVNEYYSETNFIRYGLLNDYSIYPLVFIYTGYEIRNVNHTGVILTLQYQFIDNDADDYVTVDLPIMEVGLVELVEKEGKKYYYVYSYRTYNYVELTRYEDIYPPSTGIQSDILFFPLPDPSTGNRTFYVYLLIRDPYWYRWDSPTLDDIDIALYIEQFTLIPLRRLKG